jgi:hypothetical protein
MARLYESSTDYEENITYAGETLASDRYDSEADYDRITVTYEGAVTDTPQGYASTSTTYNALTSSYNGSKTVDRTATGTGTGTSTTIQLTVHPRTGSSTGAGTSTSDPLRIVPRTGTGTGTGTSNNAIVHKHLRTSYGTGGATAGDTGIGLHIHPRTGTGSGVGTGVTTSRRLYRRNAPGTGAGTQTAAGRRYQVFRTPTDNQVDLTGSDFYSINLIPANKLVYSLYRHYQPGPRGRNVWKLTDGTYTENQPMDDTDIAIIYLGGHEHVLFDDDERDSLIAAGYGAYIS